MHSAFVGIGLEQAYVTFVNCFGNEFYNAVFRALGIYCIVCGIEPTVLEESVVCGLVAVKFWHSRKIVIVNFAGGNIIRRNRQNALFACRVGCDDRVAACRKSCKIACFNGEHAVFESIIFFA